MNVLINFSILILFVSSVSCALNVSSLANCDTYYPPSPRKYEKFVKFDGLKGGHPNGYIMGVSFYALAREDLHVALTKTDNAADRLYEFVFGTSKNTQSTFRNRTGETYDTLISVDSPKILNPLEFAVFTIKITPSGVVEVYTENEPAAFMKYTVPDASELQYITFSSHNNQPAKILYNCESDACLLNNIVKDLPE